MTPLQNLDCSTCFNKNAVASAPKPAIPLHDICPCYRPKMAMG